jgi:hypothetical protein
VDQRNHGIEAYAVSLDVEMNGRRKECGSGLSEGNNGLCPILEISRYPNCAEFPNHPCRTLAQRLTQNVRRSRRSPSPLRPVRNLIPEIASRAWATSENRRENSA